MIVLYDSRVISISNLLVITSLEFIRLATGPLLRPFNYIRRLSLNISFVFSGCDAEFVQAVVALNLNMNFLIAILVCLAIILIAVIVLAVYRKKRHVFT